MKSPLSPLYDFFGAVGAVFIVLTLLIQLVAIFGRFVQFTISGHDAYAGYFLAAGTFCALAHTLRRGDHIRVTLIIGRLKGTVRLYIEIFCLAAATFLSGYFAFYAGRLAWGSWSYNDISTEIDATPLWIPQLSMAFGVAALFLAFAEELIYVLWRRQLPAQHGADLARRE